MLHRATPLKGTRPRRYPALYQPGRALKSDALIEIVDRKLMFSAHNSGLKVLVPASGSFVDASVDAPLEVDASFMGWIDGWERGAAARVVHVREKLGPLDDVTNPEWRTAIVRYEAEAQHARENALGKLTVNVSLAIRTALDRVAAHRET